MKKLVNLLVVLLLMSSVASAQEVTGPFIKAIAGFQYLDGYDFESSNGNDFLTADIDFDLGYLAGIAGGYRFSESLALELEFTRRENSVDSVSIVNADFLGSGDVSADSFMVNLFYYITSFEYVNPYFGIGLGVLTNAELELGIDNFGTKFESDGEAFAFQGMAGVEIPVNRQFRFFFEGRAFSASSPDVISNNSSLNVAYDTAAVLGGILYVF